jgi:hypothetical protein
MSPISPSSNQQDTELPSEESGKVRQNPQPPATKTRTNQAVINEQIWAACLRLRATLANASQLEKGVSPMSLKRHTTPHGKCQAKTKAADAPRQPVVAGRPVHSWFLFRPSRDYRRARRGTERDQTVPRVEQPASYEASHRGSTACVQNLLWNATARN